MSSYTFVNFCYKNKNVKNIIDFCTTPSRELDLPATCYNKERYYLEHDPEFKNEVIQEMIKDGLDPSKDSILDYVKYSSKFSLTKRYGDLVHYDLFTKDLLKYAIYHYKENIATAKKAIKESKEIINNLKSVTFSGKTSFRELQEIITEELNNINYWEEDFKENKEKLFSFQKIWFWYYLAKIIPNCSLKYFRD